MLTAENTLTPREAAILHAIAHQSDRTLRQRAESILQWSTDPDLDRIVSATGLRRTQVQHWLRAFGQFRLNIFPSDVIWLASRGLAGSISVDQLCLQYNIDLNHARHVAQLSLTLFDQTQSVHQLSTDRRRVLEAAAVIHNVAAGIDAAQHHVVGRDIIAAHTLNGFSDVERDIIACLVLFHRKRVKSAADRLFVTLSPDIQRETLVLSALLRIGDGLDYSAAQTTQIRSIEIQPDRIDIHLDGPQAAIDAARADHKADLWRSILNVPIHFTPGDQPIKPRATHRPHRPRRFGLRPSDPMSEASRSILAQYFQRLHELEAGARDGDEDAIHDLRVAVRRLRATLRLAQSKYKDRVVKPFSSALKELASRLGAVRDADVMLEHGLAFAQAHRSPETHLDQWLDHLKLRRTAAQRDLTRYLAGQRFQKFAAAFEKFAATSSAGNRSGRKRIRPSRVSEVMPIAIWQQFSAVRAYESIAPLTLTDLHALRIDVKRLRDGLEFFSEVLGEETRSLIEPVIELQDHLGALQNACVTGELLAEYLKARSQDTGATAYQVAVEQEIKTRQDQFTRMWRPVIHASFRKLLARLLGAI